MELQQQQLLKVNKFIQSCLKIHPQSTHVTNNLFLTFISYFLKLCTLGLLMILTGFLPTKCSS